MTFFAGSRKFDYCHISHIMTGLLALQSKPKSVVGNNMMAYDLKTRLTKYQAKQFSLSLSAAA